MRQLERQRWIGMLGGGRLEPRLVTGAHARFGPGWGHRQRTLGDLHVLYGITAGAMRVRAGAIDAVAGPGTLVWVSAGARHDLLPARRDATVAAWHCRLVVGDRAGAVRPRDEALLVEGSPELGATLAVLIGELPEPSAWATERLRAWLLLLFADAWRSRASGLGLTPLQAAAVRETAARAPARARLRGTDLARAAGLTPAYFARRFAVTFGCAPREWLVAERMRRAATLLLERDAPIGELADALGYGDLFLFSRQFRRVFGVSPRAYRARAGWTAGPR